MAITPIGMAGRGGYSIPRQLCFFQVIPRMMDHELPPPSGGLPYRFQPMVLSDVDTSSARLPPSKHFARLRQDFATLVEIALNYGDARYVDKRAVRLAAGLIRHQRPHGALMSHQGVRRRAGRLLYRQLTPMFTHTARRRWFFVTLITDLGNSLEYGPVLELGRLKRDGRKTLELVGMHFIGVTELQLARYPLGGLGRTVQAHLHAVGYIDDPVSTGKDAERSVAARSTLFNWLGARVADFIPIETLDELRYRCNYMFKAPLQESWLDPDVSQRSGFRTGKCTVNRWGALRLVELLAQLTLRQATVASGDLVKPKGEWIREVEAWVAQYPARKEPDYGRAFTRVWDRSAVKHLRAAPIVRLDASQPLDPAWNEAMQPKIAQVAENQARYDARAAERNLCRFIDSDLQ